MLQKGAKTTCANPIPITILIRDSRLVLRMKEDLEADCKFELVEYIDSDFINLLKMLTGSVASEEAYTRAILNDLGYS